MTDTLKFMRVQYDACGGTNDKSRQNSEYRAFVVCIPLATFFLVARLFARLRLDAGLWLDDYLMIAALFSYYADAITGLITVREGFGLHTWYLSTEQLTTALKVSA